MLTGDLAQNWQRGGRTGPRLIDPEHAGTLSVAEDLIKIVRDANARDATRAELDHALALYAGTGTDYKTLRGLVKLLTDRCTFETVSVRDPVEIRRELFRRARAAHPIVAANSVNDERGQFVAALAEEFACAPEEIESGLFADLTANNRLIEFEELTPSELLHRYNLAQAQALLYRSIEMTLRIEPKDAANSRTLFNAIKAYRLIHSIEGSAETGYDVRLSGPVSMFHRSQKYGIQMAVFLPALLLCHGWTMRAEISPKINYQNPGASLFYELDDTQSDLRSHYLSNDSPANVLTEKLVANWERLGGRWTLKTTTEVIDLGASAFVPDLVARDVEADGEPVYLELFGFWTPKSLARRIAELTDSGFRRWLLIASDELRCSREEATDVPVNVVICKAAIDANLVLDAVNFVDVSFSHVR